MPQHEPIRILYSREHATVFPGLGVFLAGPTPADGAMERSWRRVLAQRLRADPRLDPKMIVVLPEPESGRWKDIVVETGQPQHDRAVNQQIPWEWQYLNLCDITVFWLATYWNEESGGDFGANIGPTTRWEFGYCLQEFLHNSPRRTFIVGSPEDAQSVNWPRMMARSHKLHWHTLPLSEKAKLIPDSLVDAVAEALLTNKW
jgi:hypothetical protein